MQNAKSLEKLRLSVVHERMLKRLHCILSSSARTLKELDLKVRYYGPRPIPRLCEEFEEMAGHNVLEVLSFEVFVNGEEEDSIGSAFKKLEEALVKPGWSALRQVSFKVSINRWSRSTQFFEALQFLPDKYLGHLSKLESVDFSYQCIIEDVHK